MPHTPDTHLTITPKRAYINGEPINVTGHGIKLSDPNSTEVQTVTLTVIPTSVTILDDDDPNTVSASYEAITRTTRDEAGDNYLVSLAETVDMIDAWKRHNATRAKHTHERH